MYVYFFRERDSIHSWEILPRDGFFVCSELTYQYLKCLFVLIYLILFLLVYYKIIEPGD